MNNIQELQERFFKSFNQRPTFCARIPGRVNLIGEHIDYCGFTVCPMAIEPHILIAVQVNNSSKLHIKNMEGKYADYVGEFKNMKITNDGCSPPFWADYFLCGIKGILDTNCATINSNETFGLNVLLSGNIPQSSGLSSSSALVCAAVFSLSQCCKLGYSKFELASIAAQCERYIGTQGGGMDQAIIFCAKKGCASHIFFDPLIVSDVDIPSGGTFVISQSMVTKNKASSSDFNTRVIECRLASLILAKKNMENFERITVLAKLQKRLNLKLNGMINLIKNQLHETPFSKQEICDILEITSEQLESKFLTPNTRHLTEFKLYQRALHVFQEALRVEKFCEACCADKNTTACLKILGALMNESHDSLKNLYECSHPQLDKLVDTCLLAGAYGARLTGAGWGGCVVALIDDENVKSFVSDVKKQFYAEYLDITDGLDDLIFHSVPVAGAEEVILTDDQ